MGSVRVVLDANGHALERNDYYPFGKRWEQTNTPTTNNRYHFNGKEQIGLLLDYGARFYNPDLGRWTSIDPLADDYLSISPYAYCANNPVRYIDPDGQKIVVTEGDPATGKVSEYEFRKGGNGQWGFYSADGKLYAGGSSFIGALTCALYSLMGLDAFGFEISASISLGLGGSSGGGDSGGGGGGGKTPSQLTFGYWFVASIANHQQIVTIRSGEKNRFYSKEWAIIWNMDLCNRIVTAYGSGFSTPLASLAHELAHAFDAMFGVTPDVATAVWATTIGYDRETNQEVEVNVLLAERFAMIVQNYYLRQNEMLPRTKYLESDNYAPWIENLLLWLVGPRPF